MGRHHLVRRGTPNRNGTQNCPANSLNIAGKKAQSVKCLPCMHDDLNSIPRTCVRKDELDLAYIVSVVGRQISRSRQLAGQQA